MNERIFVVGYPGEVGGANTELWHTLRLWRRFGVEVTVIPTWTTDPRWQSRLEAIGCRTVETRPEALHRVAGLAGSIVVSMCNTRFLAEAARFRQLRCRIVWVGCMNWLFPAERLHYRQFGPFDRYVFQSRYQQQELCSQLRRFGFRDEQGYIIRGALMLDDFPFRPREHRPGDVFTVGRISRAAVDKYSPRTWVLYDRMPAPRRARILGWSAELSRRLGAPPPWAECLPPGGESPGALLGTLDALVHAGGQAVENWPRVGLEAMASGVPLVADARGGWQEMIRSGKTGYLCATEEEFVACASRLAADEPHRQAMIHRARAVLEQELARPEAIFAAWQGLWCRL